MKNKILFFSFLLILAMIPLALAGQTELSAHHPSPYGEYQSLHAYTSIGIGTTSPTSMLQAVPGASAGPTVSVDRYGTGAGNAFWGFGMNNIYDNDTFRFGYTSTAYSGLSWLPASTAFIYYPNNLASYTMRIGTGGGATPVMSLTADGKVGIGVAAPTVQFERACPSGFTSIKAGNNQLGCMQTTEAGSNTWEVATDYCADNYGGRLPSNGEWYAAMANFALTDETDDWEWNDDNTGSNYHLIVGSSSITATNTSSDGSSYAFRCWIPT